MGQIINQFPGGGEDVTAEVEVQTPLVDQIMTALIGKVGDDANATAETILEGYKAWVQGEKIIGSLDPETLKHGQYVWKVYVWEEEITVENPSFTGDVNNPSTNYIKITQSSFDKSLINDINFFAGFDAGNGTNKFDYDEGVVKYFWGTGSTQKWQVISYDPEAGEILTGNAPYDGTFTFSYTGEKVLRAAQRGAFVNYIVADAEDAYPNGGVKDGYYYEKVIDPQGGMIYRKVGEDNRPTDVLFQIYQNSPYLKGNSTNAAFPDGDTFKNLKYAEFDFKGEIMPHVFSNCFRLMANSAKFKLSRNVTKINYDAFGFSHGKSGENIKFFIPDTVTYIDGGQLADVAFSDSQNLEFYCEAASKPSNWGQYWNCSSASSGRISFTTTWGVTEEEFDAL